MQFTKTIADSDLQKEYDTLKDRYFELVEVNKKVKINVEVDLSFIWEEGLDCRPYFLDAIDYLKDTNAEKQIEDKIEKLSNSINKDIQNFWNDLEEFAEKTDLCAEEIMESFS
jgi:hypothetical protein